MTSPAKFGYPLLMINRTDYSVQHVELHPT